MTAGTRALAAALLVCLAPHLARSQAATSRQLPPKIYEQFQSFVHENGGHLPLRNREREYAPGLRPPPPRVSSRLPRLPPLPPPPPPPPPSTHYVPPRKPEYRPPLRGPKKAQTSSSSQVDQIRKQGAGGCETTEGFHFAGETWYPTGCRRRKCIHFRGNFFTETDSCDSEIHNTTYKCIVEVDITAQYPACCPKYRCNPDNLGNSVK
ncbi:protein piccolo-like [Penaeus japonicus]|uniref:protein piccolo-like n=1 Tax=Penaeus japonicus TaxID=27405 RepID=UPI001C715F8D|nr:protein piccolo-like [Penaeus japonicus]